MDFERSKMIKRSFTKTESAFSKRAMMEIRGRKSTLISRTEKMLEHIAGERVSEKK
jgi:hypothetical protein